MDTIIVALPAEDQKVMQISSEKVPHLTLLNLGDSSGVDNLEEIVLFVQHAASQLSPFYLSVDHRGELGDKDADVVFLGQGWDDLKRISDFRHHLLLNNAVRKAYDAVPQFEEWTPHVTLGYPETPAHKDDSDYPGIHSIHFDRIAVFTGDYEGPDFRLEYDYGMDSVRMSDMTTSERGAAAVAELFHYGVKGMRWGVRKDDRTSQGGADSGPTSVVVNQKKPGTFAKTQGGARHPLHDDAKTALEARQKARASTTDSLSNAELRTAVERMQLEQKYDQLAFSSDRRGRGARFVAGLLGQKRYGKKRQFTDTDEQVGEQVRKAVKVAVAAAAA